MIGFDTTDHSILSCPKCRGELQFGGFSLNGKIALQGALKCAKGHQWRVKRGVPHLFDAKRLEPRERVVDLIYDVISPFHDCAVDYVLPLLEFPSGRVDRTKYIEELKLDALPASGHARVLEIGVGSGANIPLIFDRLVDRPDVSYWGVDINEKMLNAAIRTGNDHADQRLRFAFADAHRLPFADNNFDCVLNVGSINAYRNPAQGISEMLRVAKPGAPIVVVDEELDQERRNCLGHKMVFKALTFFDRIVTAPLDILPSGTNVHHHFPVSRYFYCLAFSKDANTCGAAAS